LAYSSAATILVSHSAPLNDRDRKISPEKLHKAEQAVAQLVKALRYKPEGRGFDFRWYQEFFIHINFPATLWPWGRLSLLQKWVQTYQLHVLIVSKSRCLNLVEPSGIIIGPYKNCFTLRTAAMHTPDFDVIELSWISRYYLYGLVRDWKLRRTICTENAVKFDI